MVTGCERPSTVVRNPTYAVLSRKQVSRELHARWGGGSQKVTNDDEGEGGGHDTPQNWWRHLWTAPNTTTKLEIDITTIKVVDTQLCQTRTILIWKGEKNSWSQTIPAQPRWWAHVWVDMGCLSGHKSPLNQSRSCLHILQSCWVAWKWNKIKFCLCMLCSLVSSTLRHMNLAFYG